MRPQQKLRRGLPGQLGKFPVQEGAEPLVRIEHPILGIEDRQPRVHRLQEHADPRIVRVRGRFTGLECPRVRTLQRPLKRGNRLIYRSGFLHTSGPHALTSNILMLPLHGQTVKCETQKPRKYS